MAVDAAARSFWRSPAPGSPGRSAPATRGADGANARRSNRRSARQVAAAHPAGRVARIQPAAHDFHRRAGLVCCVSEFAAKGSVAAISNLNTYNFMFIIARSAAAVAAAALHRFRVAQRAERRGSTDSVSFSGRDRRDTDRREERRRTYAFPACSGAAFTHLASHATFAPIIGIYSAVLGLFVPSGGGKWVIEAPYVMHAANALAIHLGWVVQIYNAAEALPNLINPFWMLPILGILGLRARDLIGFTFVQFRSICRWCCICCGARHDAGLITRRSRRTDRCAVIEAIARRSPAIGRARRPIVGRPARGNAGRHRAARG